MEIQSFELLDPARQGQLDRASLEERERNLIDTENISESKHRTREEQEPNVDAGKRRV